MSEGKFWLSLWGIVAASLLTLVGLTEGCRERDQARELRQVELHYICVMSGKPSKECE